MFISQDEWLRWLLDGNTASNGIGAYRCLGNMRYIETGDLVMFDHYSWKTAKKVLPKKRVLKSIWQLKTELPKSYFTREGAFSVFDNKTIPSRHLHLFDGETNVDDWPDEFYTEIDIGE